MGQLPVYLSKEKREKPPSSSQSNGPGWVLSRLIPVEFPHIPRARGDPYSGDVGDPVDRHLLLAVQPLPVLDGPGKERERWE